MKFSIAALGIFLAVLALFSQSLRAEHQISQAALHFYGMPLGNVARILSAKFGTTITIDANARAPITGDFSALDLPAALQEAARQAHLAVRRADASPSSGFCLVAAKEPATRTEAPAVKAALAEAAHRRAELLREQADLLDPRPPRE